MRCGIAGGNWQLITGNGAISSFGEQDGPTRFFFDRYAENSILPTPASPVLKFTHRTRFSRCYFLAAVYARSTTPSFSNFEYSTRLARYT